MSLPMLPTQPKCSGKLFVDLDSFSGLMNPEVLLRQLLRQHPYKKYEGIVNGEKIHFKNATEMFNAFVKLIR